MKEKTKKNKKHKIDNNVKFTILAIIVIILFSIIISPVTLQNDTYYTITIGKDILNSGGIDLQDHYSWHPNLPYYYPHWAYDIMIFLIYNFAGMWGIYISTIVLASIMGISLYLLNCKLSKNRLTSFFITLGAMYLLRDFIAARAQLVTYILFIFEIWCIESYLKTGKIRYGFGLFIIATIIANVHSAVWPLFFVFFLPYVVSYLWTCILDADIIYRITILWNKLLLNINKRLKKVKDREEKINIYTENINELEEKILLSKTKREKRRENPYKIQMEKNQNTKKLIIIGIICIITGLLTPIKDMPYTYLYRTLQGNSTSYINEHLPLTLANDAFTAIALVLFLVILIFTDTKIKLKDLFMMSGLILLAFLSRRQTSMLALIGCLTVNQLIAGLFNKYDKEGTKKIIKEIVSATGVIITLLVIVLCGVYEFKDKKDARFINESSYPVQASDYILENLDIENMKLYNEYNYGSYLLFRGIPVFIDSRSDLYSPEFNGTKNENGEYVGRDIFTDFMNISNIGLYYEDKFKEYGITHLLITRNSKLNIFISRDSNYKELYSDYNFILYERLNANQDV